MSFNELNDPPIEEMGKEVRLCLLIGCVYYYNSFLLLVFGGDCQESCRNDAAAPLTGSREGWEVALLTWEALVEVPPLVR